MAAEDLEHAREKAVREQHAGRAIVTAVMPFLQAIDFTRQADCARLRSSR